MRSFRGGRWRIVAAAAAMATMPGCITLPPPPAAKDLQRDAMANAAVPANWKAGGDPAPVADRWLATFGDPVLIALVDEALVHNADL